MKTLSRAAAAAAALLLTACATPGSVDRPPGASDKPAQAAGGSDNAVQAYRIYRAHCESFVAGPVPASVSGKRASDGGGGDAAAQAKIIAAAVASAVKDAVAQAFAAHDTPPAKPDASTP